jgi:lipopolysaccharide/colanic/teichoic acid biosynthesis glycosyltransferase
MTPSRGLPRAFEAVVAGVALVVLSPLLAAIALAVAFGSRGGALFRQTRIGRGGEPFMLYKFRTMRAGDGPRFTAGGDPRVTPLGRRLRRSKLDELPELWNVLAGDMSLVGLRPEVPDYVDLGDPLWRRALAVRPGLTSLVALRLRDEESLLAQIEDDDRQRFYAQVLVPYKLLGHLEYLERRTAWSDLAVLGRTLLAIVRAPRPPSREEIERPDRNVEE